MNIVTVLVILTGSTLRSTFAIKPNSNHRRILNGQRSRIEDFPFMVSLHDRNSSFRCGGTIITIHWILTAALCLPISYIEYGSERQGRAKIGEWNDVSEVVKARRARFNGSDDYVVALLRVEPSIKFSPTAQPIKLAASDDFIQWSALTYVAGWGADSRGGDNYRYLLYSTLTAIWPTECMDLLTFRYSKNNFCLLGARLMRGDVGGPVILADGSQKQIGIVLESFWKVSDGSLLTNVALKVSLIRNWVDRVMDETNLNQ